VTVADDPTGSQTGPHGDHVARSFAWTAGRALLTRGLSLISFVILARLLSPHEYGLAALASVFGLLLGILAAGGFAQALVQRPDIDRTDLDTVFWFATALGAVLAVVLCIAAWPLADVFDQPDLTAVLQVMSISILVSGAASAHLAVLQRRMAFDTIAKVGVTANVIATIFGVAFAFLGFGVWALVVQSVIGPVGTGIGVILRSGYRPGRSVSLERMRSLFRFSRNVLGMSFMTFFNQRTDDFLIGSFLGSAALGIYTVGYRLLTVMLDVLVTSVQGVMFPTFSRVQAQPARLRTAYLAASRMGAFIAFPAFMFVAAAAPDIVHVVFGAKWDRSVPIMQILCFAGPLWAVMQFNSALLTSVGRPEVVLRLAVAGTALQVAAFAIAVNFGIAWVAAAYVVRLYVMAPPGLILASRLLGGSTGVFMRGLFAPALATAAMAASVLLVRSALSSAPEVVRLCSALAGALPTYLVVMRFLSAAQMAEAARYLRAVAPRRGSLAR
jgi:PST family polysaccharide transporter